MSSRRRNDLHSWKSASAMLKNAKKKRKTLEICSSGVKDTSCPGLQIIFKNSCQFDFLELISVRINLSLNSCITGIATKSESDDIKKAVDENQEKLGSKEKTWAEDCILNMSRQFPLLSDSQSFPVFWTGVDVCLLFPV